MGLVILILAIIGYRYSSYYKITGVTSLPEGVTNISIAILVVIIVAIFIAIQQKRLKK